MTQAGAPTLHVLPTRDEGEFAALALRAHLAPGDEVLTLGPASRARAVAQLLGRPVVNRPLPTGATPDRRIGAIAARTAAARGAGAIRRWPEAASTPDVAALPARAAARAAAGVGDDLVLAPLTDRPDAVDARALLFVAGVLEIVGERVALLLPERARRLDEALAYLHNADLGVPVRIIKGAWIAALPAADILIEPADADDDVGRGQARAIAAALGVPLAPTEAWRLDPDAATHSLPSEIRATVAPVLERARAARAGGGATVGA